MSPALRALGWDHPRCVAPMLAATAAWEAGGGVPVIWSWRSLASFGDEPLAALAARHDLLVIDHPMCGAAADERCLIPLDDLLPPEALHQLAGRAVGPSHRSYAYAGRQWALAVDAACQVAVAHPARLATLPMDWAEVLALARLGGVAVALAPAHALSALLSLLAGLGSAPGAGERLAEPELELRALDTLRELASLGPVEAFGWEPPDLLARMVHDPALRYCPLVYGYVSYSPPLRFTAVPGTSGGVLGGAGIAISTACRRRGDAAAFAAWLAGDDAQRGPIARSGGQPAARAAWSDASLDAGSGGFFAGTLAGLERAWTRPREPWWPRFQLSGGERLTAGLRSGEAAESIMAAVEERYSRARGQTIARS